MNLLLFLSNKMNETLYKSTKINNLKIIYYIVLYTYVFQIYSHQWKQLLVLLEPVHQGLQEVQY